MTEELRFTPRDDGFHFAELGDDWWATETAWFAFCNPERKLGGWLYSIVRPNIGTIQGGAWVWDDSAALPFEVLYSASYSAMPLPRDQDLTDIRMPTGVSIRVVEPCMSYDLGYEDGDRLKASLRFDGVMPPEPMRSKGSTYGKARHFDQFGRVTGHLILYGERIEIDCLAMRDRTWGRRPEDRPRQAAYVTGITNPEHGFLAVTNTRPEGDLVSFGFLRRDGRTVSLASGERRVERDPATGWVRGIIIEATDEEGRELHAVGHALSRIVLNHHTFIDNNSLIRWEINGEEGWGEDQDMWPVHRWSAMRREVLAERKAAPA